MSKVYVVMGVSGCGKTTVGRALAHKLQLPFYDGDDFHPAENVDKMANGIPLTDADRLPWLARLHDLLAAHLKRGEGVVVACSALKRSYREQLRAGLEEVQFVYLRGSFALIWERLTGRAGHYMKANMLQSQFDALEPPAADEALIFDVEAAPDEIADRIAASATEPAAGSAP
jgi:gluconokinase